MWAREVNTVVVVVVGWLERILPLYINRMLCPPCVCLLPARQTDTCVTRYLVVAGVFYTLKILAYCG